MHRRSTLLYGAAGVLVTALVLAALRSDLANPSGPTPWSSGVSGDLSDWSAVADSIDHTVAEWTEHSGSDFIVTPVLHLSEEAFHGVAGAWLMPDFGVGVIDSSRRIRLYDSGGELVAVKGGPGAGPGEFREVGRAMRANDSLVAYDPALRRISFWSLDGEHVNDTSLTNESLAVYPALFLYGIRADGLLLFGAQGTGAGRNGASTMFGRSTSGTTRATIPPPLWAPIPTGNGSAFRIHPGGPPVTG